MKPAKKRTAITKSEVIYLGYQSFVFKNKPKIILKHNRISCPFYKTIK
jgi:hypothetical protein